MLSASLLLSWACGPGDRLEIEQVRPAPPEANFARIDASSSERFGGGPGGGHDHGEHAQATGPSFEFETPDDWVELAPQQFREINLRPGGNPELECYLTILQGGGGGLSANVNRWRSQLGLEAISEQEAALLPSTELFGRPAALVDLRAEGTDARALLGVVFIDERSMATVKMTGPADLVEEQRAGFDLFCSTLAARVPGSGGAGAGPVSTPAIGPANPGAANPHGQRAQLTYDLPEGWSTGPESSMRLVNLLSPGASQCYVIRLSGEAGGLENNLNRWRSEVGLDPIDRAAIDQLPKVELLGSPCSLLEVSGEYRGMGTLEGPGKTLLGVALIGSESSLFVKMVGSEADIAAEKQHFLEFIASLSDV